GFTWTVPKRAPNSNTPTPTTSGTHDILLYCDIFESLLYASYDQGTLLGDTIKVRERLRETCWYHPPGKETDGRPRVCNSLVHEFDPMPPSFFDAAGDRQSHTGEHLVWLKPDFTDDNVNLTSKISVWSMQAGAWELVKAHDATYNQSRLEGE